MDWNNEPGFDRERESYLQLNLNGWLAKHGIENEGRKQGEANQPPPDAVDLDATEAQILDWVNRRATICRDNVSGHLADLQRDLSDMASEQPLVLLRQTVKQYREDARIALDAKRKEGQNKLVTVEREVQEDSEDFARFRQQSGLTRQADYSERRKALVFILACFFIELVMNATLLMGVSTFGLIGSIAQMGLISVVNVLIMGLATGELLRFRNSRERPRVAAAWAGMVVLVAVVAGFNLAVGHFRDSMQAVVNDPNVDILALGNDVAGRLVTAPFGLDSFQSFLLALLGFLFFCVASWKWLRRDDPYPGYGRRHRQIEALRARYVATYDDAQGNLREVFAEHESKLEDIQSELRIRLSKWNDVCIRGRKIVAEFPVQLGQYQLDLKQLLSAYRTANRGARTEPPPPHFAIEPKINADIVAKAPAFDPPPEQQLTDVMNTVHKAVSALQRQFARETRHYKTLERLLQSGTKG